MNKFFVVILIITATITLKAQDIQECIDSLISSNQIPELGFAVISSDSILELQVRGFHRIDLQNQQTRAAVSDYFHLGSNTKSITGFIAGYLVESNQIKWTTKFFDLFPGWKQQSNPAYDEMTLADLLSHRASIQPYTSGFEYQKLPQFKGNRSEQRKQFAEYVLREEPVKESSGQVYNYSNAGYSIAALMLEEVSGKTWEQLTREIMSTAMKANIGFGWPNTLGPDQPYGHWMENDTLRALPPEINYNLALGEPAGDISMTLPDYARFIQLNLKGLSGVDNMLKASTYHFLHFGSKDYAIGWANVNNETEQVSEHSGSAGTFFCYTFIDNRKGLAYIVVANNATVLAQQGIQELFRVLKKKYNG